MIPEQVKSEIIKRRAIGATWTKIAEWLEQEHGIQVHRTTIQKWFDKNHWEPEEELLVNEEGTDNRIKLDKKLATYKGEADYYKKLYNGLLKENIKQDVIVQTIQEYTKGFPSVPLKHLNNSDKTPFGHQKQIVVSPLSDTHVGEQVYKEQMRGLNEYNFDIFNKRMYGWANQVLKHTAYRRQIAPIDELMVPMLGDMISGDIHDELARSNQMNNMEQMIRGASIIAQALMYLAPHFTKITVPCVVGNHGRMTRKPPMKDKFMDWDYMLYQWVATFCKNQDNIEFHIPRSFMTTFKIHDKVVLIMHGDSISGAGSSGAITGAIAKLRSVFQFRKTLQREIEDSMDDDAAIEFDSVMIGHFHRIDEIDIGTGELHICGTMKGPDEFALQRLHAATKPKQLVTYWHPQYGYIGRDIIYLNRYDNSKRKFFDKVPEKWGDLSI
tara:strand:- start:331 stop:1650 length:1320 start_codon:yes stop_codon:yes gene_type:complete